MIDLAPMNQVDVDPSTRTAKAAGGANWADVERPRSLMALPRQAVSLLPRALAASRWEEGTDGSCGSTVSRATTYCPPKWSQRRAWC